MPSEIKQFPEQRNVYDQLKRTHEALKTKDYEAAGKCLEIVEDLDKDNAEALFLKSGLYAAVAMKCKGDDAITLRAEGIGYLLASANLNYSFAQLSLAKLFEEGVPDIALIQKSYKDAYIWAYLALDNGESIKTYVNKLRAKLTNEELIDAQEQIREFNSFFH